MAAHITSITGLQNLPNLENFNADYNALQTLDLSNLTKLTYVDVSDCDELGSTGLKTINLNGCTSLQSLRLDDNDFSAGTPDFSNLANLESIDLDECRITNELDFTNNTNLISVDIHGNEGLTSVILGEQKINEFIGDGCSLTETVVNNILIALDGNGIFGGYVDLTGATNAAPTGGGKTAKQNLIDKDWNINVNTAPPGNVGIAASSDFDIVGDFTIEMFVNMNDLNGFPRPYSFGAYPAPNALSIEGGALYFWANNQALINGTFEPTIGDWYHICVQRNSDTVRMFVDGVEIASTPSYADDIPSQGLPLTIGYGNEENSGFNGLMSNFRWTAAAVYNTAGFSVPTSPLTDLADTKLLIFQGNDLTAQLTDNSGNGHNATNAGAVFSTNDPFNSAAGSLQMGDI